jgi:hypothetical protein
MRPAGAIALPRRDKRSPAGRHVGPAALLFIIISALAVLALFASVEVLLLGALQRRR